MGTGDRPAVTAVIAATASAADWLEAFGTIAAVVVALGFAIRERSQRMDERRYVEEREQAEASRAMASGVVSTLHTPPVLHGDAPEVIIWINVFSADPLRNVEIRLSWGRAISMDYDRQEYLRSEDPFGDDDGSRWFTNPDDPSVSVYRATHIDPGERGWTQSFYCQAGDYDELAISARIRWFDRWDQEWSMVPGRAPARVPADQQRSLPEGV